MRREEDFCCRQSSSPYPLYLLTFATCVFYLWSSLLKSSSTLLVLLNRRRVSPLILRGLPRLHLFRPLLLLTKTINPLKITGVLITTGLGPTLPMSYFIYHRSFTFFTQLKKGLFPWEETWMKMKTLLHKLDPVCLFTNRFYLNDVKYLSILIPRNLLFVNIRQGRSWCL